ncbi:glycosyltransferase family 61 protein [Burkholderia vietnamiensis]|uniref:glycosyltransferase family 61 protein n=1 Tax=Burkholderia vietnamiensis TaxID=60552 RepID=UPI001BA145A8|nr:glycosyltransferase 61 family protein [Burkholderia vietnamiensis]MBR8358466.1 glycosyltransferase family 61 protein [Burkholderia vietnamiensis]
MDMYEQLNRRRSQADRWVEVEPESQYERRTPNLFNFFSHSDDVRRYILNEINRRYVAVPPQDVYFFDGAYASDYTVLFNRKKEVLATSIVDHNEIPTFEQLSTIAEYAVGRVAGRAAYIWKSGKNNYGHMLVEMISKCESLLKAGLTPITLIVPSLPQNLRIHFEDAVSTAYGNAFTLLYMTTPLVQVDELVVPGPVTRHNSQKSHAVSTLAARLREATVGRQGFEKIYVSRSAHPNRRMENEYSIENLVQAHGFKIVRPETMSLLEQIATFSSARHVMGPLGAGMTNTLFSPENALVTIIDPGLYDFFFYDLCGLRGQQFNWVFTRPIELNDGSRLHSNYLVDVALMKQVLDVMAG